MDTFVDRAPVEVLRVRAPTGAGGPRWAFGQLESKLASLRGRRFYGTFRALDEGEEYYACVERLPGEDAAARGVDSGTIPGGTYVRRKLADWEPVIAAGQLGRHFVALAQGCARDTSRPDVEYYRSSTELHLLVPVLDRTKKPPGPTGLRPTQP